ncbi:GNAT family protein [Streptomyces sp. 549]|uniref:GNAT family N-acetyltransferase n=1 Tax=Streptomyces sp. 549 TaxID=3049076 RepID=UPI0024C39EEE|nr:GNAT family protein [Streptomyces sp. 549]MDK1476829.1 GNAT family protein [Streptomyces sp. 549]
MVELRAFTLADAGVIVSWISGPAELLTWAGPGFTWPLDDPQLAAYVVEPGRRTWTGIGPDGRLVGHASLRLAADGRSARLGRVLIAPEARGQGYGAALLTQVLKFAFAQPGLERVELGVFTHNSNAVRLYEGLGFRVDQVLPDVERVDGESWSALQMSLARADWAAGVA